jgi:DNA helicase-2/ATP-dependent DNA helicase PcrA
LDCNGRSGYGNRHKFFMNQNIFEKRYSNLNGQQQLAVDTLDGPVLVIAGPGSGKTELLSLRVANILRSTDTEPNNIICLTFTDAAAVNMRQRLVRLIGAEAYRVAIHTFHGFSTDIINRHPEYFYDGVAFRSADKLQQRVVLAKILESLPYNHPFRKTRTDQGNVYIDDIASAISHLKRSGFQPEDFAKIVAQNSETLRKINPLLAVFDQTMNLKALPAIQDLIIELVAISGQYEKIAGVLPLPALAALQLRTVLKEVERLGKATPLSNWKRDYLEKNDDQGRVLKDTSRIDKNLALAEVYAAYQLSMRQEGYYDFDDMLLDVIEALSHHEELRYELQEQFQYVLVDEFQDTNNAQMRILSFLTESPINEGRPNIMAVGDDDQAVYKFQGAEVGNIIDFERLYIDTKIIVLTQNYRSTQPILDLAREIIVQGEKRLENTIEVIKKDLVAANTQLEHGHIYNHSYASLSHELNGVAKQIKKILVAGANADDIAVICKQHKYLEMLVPFLHRLDIPVRYDRQQNVLQEPHIHQIIQIVRFAVTISRNRKEADELLPEILSYPFWQLDRLAVWRLSRQSFTDSNSWLECMVDNENEQLKDIATLLIDVADISKTEPIDVVLERVIGAHQLLSADDEFSDEEISSATIPPFVSPLKRWYFSREKFDTHRAEYLRFLSALKTFVQALHSHQPDKPMLAEDMIAFVDSHTSNSIAINDTSPFVSGDRAVSLLTAHGAKGLEFETVFIINCQQDIWAKEGRHGVITAPLNVPLSSAANEADDFLRLFYVAITRAKRNLYLSSFSAKDDGKESELLSFIADRQVNVQQPDQIEAIATIEASWHTYHQAPVVEDEQALLLPLVEQYKMSVTHLNNFLDVSRGGPQLFLEQNLLRFPQPQSPQAAYGSAVHESIRDFYVRFKRDKLLPDLQALLDFFHKNLTSQWLSKKDFEDYLARGNEELTLYYDVKSSDLHLTDEVEFNFSDQQVMVENACLTGKIDRIVQLEEGRVSVHDIKTGKPTDRWQSSEIYTKLKLHKYRHQLQFYKLLIERSRKFGGKTVVEQGVLEFVESYQGRFVELPLPSQEMTDGEMDRLKQLIVVVYDHIQQLNFPDTSDYGDDVAAVLRFEDDLLGGKI